METAITLEFFDVADSHYGARAKNELEELVKEFEGKKIKLKIEEKNAFNPAYRRTLEKYIESLTSKNFNPSVPIVIPLIALNGKPIFIGFHPNMKDVLRKAIERQ